MAYIIIGSRKSHKIDHSAEVNQLMRKKENYIRHLIVKDCTIIISDFSHSLYFEMG